MPEVAGVPIDDALRALCVNARGKFMTPGLASARHLPD